MENAEKPRVAVLFGGRSGEHGISCVTAGGVMAAIDRDVYDVLPIGITTSGRWVLTDDDPARWSITDGRLPEVTEADGLPALSPQAVGDTSVAVAEAGQAPRSLGGMDVVFPLLHGPFGEDGTVQGLLELSDTRYVGAGVLSSALSMDKHHMKVALAGAGLPIGPHVVVRPREWEADPELVVDAVAALGFPVFVKPARAGSSLGVSRVGSVEAVRDAVERAREHDPKVVVEAALEGREIECGVLQAADGGPPLTSLPGEIAMAAGSSHEFYDFEAKYLDDAAVRLDCPADLPEETTARVRDLAARTFEAVSCEGLARVDFFVTGGGEVVVNEINTMPGFTPTSMFPRMWAASGVDYPELVDRLIRLALARPVGLR